MRGVREYRQATRQRWYYKRAVSVASQSNPGGRGGEGTRTQDTRQTALLNTRALCCRVSAVVFDRPSNKLTLVLLHRYHFSDGSL